MHNMKKPKSKKMLLRRIANWEKIVEKNEKNKKAYRKPGSLKK